MTIDQLPMTNIEIPHSLPKNTGWIEVIAGCMFSGKTEELIRRLRRAQIARQNVKIFKPEIDTRYSGNSIVSHNEQSLPSVIIKDINEVIDDLLGFNQDPQLPPGLSNGQDNFCLHDWKNYEGFTESYDYCDKCDKKRR